MDSITDSPAIDQLVKSHEEEEEYAPEAQDSAVPNELPMTKLLEILSLEDEQNEKPKAEEEVKQNVDAEPNSKKKKKKKKNTNKSTLKKGGDQPSGFEEYYVDAPITPTDHAIELELYDQSIDYFERLEVAVSRFYARRKFSSWQKDFFDKFLSFGGFDTGPRPFGSLDPKEEEELSAAEIARLKVSVSLSDWVIHGQGFVDYNGIVKAFLSTYIVKAYGPESQVEIKQRVNIIRNFLNYLLYHNVCPEYNDQIHEARKTCDQAEKELWLCLQCARMLPGDFNVACSAKFGGYYRIGSEEEDTTGGDINKEIADASFGLGESLTNRVFHGGMAAVSSQEMFMLYKQQADGKLFEKPEATCTTLQVKEIQMSEAKVKKFYEQPVMHGIEPIGKLLCVTWHNPETPPEDLTAEEEAEIEANGRPVYKYEFWVEDSVLEKMFPGMYLEATVYETSFGLHYFDTVVATMVSYQHSVPNLAMEGYKEHQWLEQRESYGNPELAAYVPNTGDEVGEDAGNSKEDLGAMTCI